jgi:hypothetical protein
MPAQELALEAPGPLEPLAVQDLPTGVRAQGDAAVAAEIAPASSPVPSVVLATLELRTDVGPDPTAGQSATAPLTTASVPAPEKRAETAGGPAVTVDHTLPAMVSMAMLPPTDAASPASDTAHPIWIDGAAICPRDWVSADDAGAFQDRLRDCARTGELIASVENEDLFALEEAAAEQAETLAALPRIPLPRPEPPADWKPAKPVRTSRSSSSWPAEPPPNCAAGQRAKWHFVDRKAGTKEWYCR